MSESSPHESAPLCRPVLVGSLAAAPNQRAVPADLVQVFEAQLARHSLTADDVRNYSPKDLDELLRDVLQYSSAVDRALLRRWLASTSPICGNDVTGGEGLSSEELTAQLTPPDAFVCSISGDLMDDPVFTCDGHSYDRRAIERWLTACPDGKWTSPNTGLVLESRQLVPNHSLRSQIAAWREQRDALVAKQRQHIERHGLQHLLPSADPVSLRLLEPVSQPETRTPSAHTIHHPAAGPQALPQGLTQHSERCHRCQVVLVGGGRVVRWQGRAFHEPCFLCGSCQRPISETRFAAENGVPYHAECIARLVGDLCARCGGPIAERMAKALGRKWHPECFVCASCNEPIAGNEFVNHRGQPYHPGCPTTPLRTRQTDPRNAIGLPHSTRSPAVQQRRTAPRQQPTSQSLSEILADSRSERQLLQALQQHGSRNAHQLHRVLAGVRPFRNTII
eukprot:TRINITY_DN2266_c0_g1_i1.p1 TRINITY_DN2266_c0_g1~~TRINITY_DN2266_c0_g1_i1.p1  ORF type:complete len:459 (-),score=30.02 TRINITY_DN2266_c0_g1_i1:924-2273(-)